MENSSQILSGTAIGRVAYSLLEFLLPPRCPNCSQKIEQHGFICGKCWSELTPLVAPYCDRCALPFEFEIDGEHECGECLRNQPAYDWARAPVSYEDLGRSLVLRLKHSGMTALVPAMARMMATSVYGKPIDMVMPVPLHRWRFLRRRYNQSGLLAAAISKHLNIPVEYFALQRRKSTPRQGGLGKKARFRNVASAFIVSSKGAVQGKHIVLVDDVLTTGATAHECARALKRAGAASVGVVAFARVGKPVVG